jgi:hypothetical protein
MDGAYQTRRVFVHPTVLIVGWLALTAAYVAALTLAQRAGYNTWAAVLIAPILFCVSLPFLHRQAARESDPRAFTVFALALAVKLIASIARYVVAFIVYGGVADATQYYSWGQRISANFRAGYFTTGLDGSTGTNFVRALSGVVYTGLGPTKIGGFLVFSWISFWGLFLLYRAFVIAVPEGRRTTYRWLVLFMPSLLYWPSSLGKEAWMVLGLGVMAFGAASWFARRGLRSFLWIGVGLLMLGVVRPHIAAIAGLALVAAYLVRPAPRRFGTAAPVVKVLVLGLLIAASAVLVVRTDRFLRDAGVGDGGFDQALSGTTERTSQGGSAFVPSVATSPVRLPAATVTVLFRPLIPEAHNTEALFAALEGTALLAWSVWRWRWIWAAIRSMRRQPYVAFAVVYVGIFIVAFSSIANFGLLARQRVQMLPLYLVVLSIPPRTAEQEDSKTDALAGTHA